MKRILLGVFLLMAVTANAQYRPYYNVGVGVTSGDFVYSAEVGAYNAKTWWAAGVSATEVGQDYSWAVSAKNYLKLAAQGNVTEFLYQAVNITADRYRTFSYEPGVAVVLNLSDHWAPQFTLSVPFVDGTKVFRNITPVVGLSLNYFY